MNQNKFENVVLYICENAHGRMTTTRLNKLLWLIDKTAFLRNAQTVTDWSYIRKRFGPVPKDNYDAFGVMADKSKLRITLEHGEGFETAFYAALKKPDMTVFSEAEKNVMEDVMKNYVKVSTDMLVELSHDLVWATYEDGETIPFEAYLSVFPVELPSVKNKIDMAEKEYGENVYC